MYNTDLPTRAELPSTAQLIKSTVAALIAAIAILVTIVLPAEYGIDPTGIGRALQLTEMGEIKQQLATEAEADRKLDAEAPSGAAPTTEFRFPWGLARLMAVLLAQPAQAAERSDETIIELKPTEGVEWKMTAAKGTPIRYTWAVAGGVVNYDMHGSPADGGKEVSYKTARGIAGDEGVMTAGFDGIHGWFFRNRGAAVVTITLKTSGDYTDLKRVK